VLRIIFGPKRDEVTEGWSKLHNEELHNLYSSPSIIRVIKSRRVSWVGNVARMGRRGISYVLMRKPERKGQLGRPGRAVTNFVQTLIPNCLLENVFPTYFDIEIS
jgi:hypothetical protein